MTCDSCGDERFFDVLEVFGDGAWLLDACCEGYEASLQEDIAYAMELPPHERIRFLKPLREKLGDWGFDVRNVVDDDFELRFDYGLELGEVELLEAKRFVRDHHRHNDPPVGWKWGHAARRRDTDELVAVAMVGRPISRHLAARGWLEVNRLCANPALGERTFNASSMLYAAAAKEARRRRAPKIVTYTLESESGASLIAAGWIHEHTTKAESWHRDGRPREDKAPTCKKKRWAPAWCAEPPAQMTLELEAA